MRGIDREVLARFLELAGDRLRGDWVLIGGVVLPLLGVDHRATVDIDVAGPDGAGMDQTLALMGIAEELGLPVEAINQAGAWFLRRVRGWEENVVEVHRGTTARLLVPNALLFVLLKLERLTESDLDDCRKMLGLARRRNERVDRQRLRRTIGRALEREGSAGRRARLESLRDELGRTTSR